MSVGKLYNITCCCTVCGWRAWWRTCVM